MSQEKKSLYKAELMDHFKHPRNKQVGSFPHDMLTARGSIPRCGDDIEIGVAVSDEDVGRHIDIAGFRGRGCSVCLASASIMTEAVTDKSVDSALGLTQLMRQWVENELTDDSAIPELLRPLEAVKDHPARKKCVMLSWNALSNAISTNTVKS